MIIYGARALLAEEQPLQSTEAGLKQGRARCVCLGHGDGASVTQAEWVRERDRIRTIMVQIAKGLGSMEIG